MNVFIKYGMLCWFVFCFTGDIAWSQTPEGTLNNEIVQWQSILEDLTTDEQAWREAAKRLIELNGDEAKQALSAVTTHMQNILQGSATTKQECQEVVMRLAEIFCRSP